MKKYKIRNLLYLLIGIVVLSTFKVNALLPLSGKTIVIDPGHGGKDPGTVSNSVYESDINLKISKYLEYYLSTNGASVILIRNGNYDLSSPNIYNRKRSDFDNRIKIINNNNADMYLSIHLNYLTDSRYYGAQVFYNNDNKKLAESVQEYLNKNTNGDRKVKKIPTSTYMYDKLKTKGILVECGFLSNSMERSKLVTKEYQMEFARVLSEAISHYYN